MGSLGDSDAQELTGGNFLCGSFFAIFVLFAVKLFCGSNQGAAQPQLETSDPNRKERRERRESGIERRGEESVVFWFLADLLLLSAARAYSGLAAFLGLGSHLRHLVHFASLIIGDPLANLLAPLEVTRP